jgi:heme oxygenase
MSFPFFSQIVFYACASCVFLFVPALSAFFFLKTAPLCTLVLSPLEVFLQDAPPLDRALPSNASLSEPKVKICEDHQVLGNSTNYIK